jgi:hypothetical protein
MTRIRTDTKLKSPRWHLWKSVPSVDKWLREWMPTIRFERTDCQRRAMCTLSRNFSSRIALGQRQAGTNLREQSDSWMILGAAARVKKFRRVGENGLFHQERRGHLSKRFFILSANVHWNGIGVFQSTLGAKMRFSRKKRPVWCASALEYADVDFLFLRIALGSSISVFHNHHAQAQIVSMKCTVELPPSKSCHPPRQRRPPKIFPSPGWADIEVRSQRATVAAQRTVPTTAATRGTSLTVGRRSEFPAFPFELTSHQAALCSLSS